MSVKLRLIILFGTFLFFILLGLSIIEFAGYDMYFESGKFWVLSVVMGASIGTFCSIAFLKKAQSGLDRFRILMICLVVGVFTGPGLMGWINKFGATPYADHTFIYYSSVPIFFGDELVAPESVHSDYMAVVLESSSGFLKFKLRTTEELKSMKKGDRVSMTVMHGLLGFDYFLESSLQKVQ